jgi:hypothetical protein
VNPKRWEIKIQDIKCDNTSIYTSERKRTAVLDSFYSKIALPAQDFNDFRDYFMQKVPNTKCDDVKGCYFP